MSHAIYWAGCSGTGGCGRASHALPTVRLLIVGTSLDELGRSDASAFVEDFRRYFGMITTWHLHSHLTWGWLCHSWISSYFLPKGPSRSRSLCLSRRNSSGIARSSSGRTARGRSSISAIGLYLHVFAAISPSVPAPRLQTQSRPAYHRGEWGIDNPRVITSVACDVGAVGQQAGVVQAWSFEPGLLGSRTEGMEGPLHGPGHTD